MKNIIPLLSILLLTSCFVSKKVGVVDQSTVRHSNVYVPGETINTPVLMSKPDCNNEYATFKVTKDKSHRVETTYVTRDVYSADKVTTSIFSEDPRFTGLIIMGGIVCLVSILDFDESTDSDVEIQPGGLALGLGMISLPIVARRIEKRPPKYKNYQSKSETGPLQKRRYLADNENILVDFNGISKRYRTNENGILYIPISEFRYVFDYDKIVDAPEMTLSGPFGAVSYDIGRTFNIKKLISCLAADIAIRTGKTTTQVVKELTSSFVENNCIDFETLGLLSGLAIIQRLQEHLDSEYPLVNAIASVKNAIECYND